MAPHSSTLAWKIHGRKSLVGCSRWGREESDTTERLHFHFSPSCIGEGNGNPLQCSCLENPRDGRAWWAAVYGVAQSRTWLKWLSKSPMRWRYSHYFYFSSENTERLLQSVGAKGQVLGIWLQLLCFVCLCTVFPDCFVLEHILITL